MSIFIGARSIGDRVDWTKGERALARALTGAIELLDGQLRHLIYQDFERVDELADEVGERAIVAAFPNPAMAIALFDIFDRWGDAEDEAENRLVQITADLQGSPASGSEFDDEGLRRRLRRPAFEAAITYDRTTGAMSSPEAASGFGKRELQRREKAETGAPTSGLQFVWMKTQGFTASLLSAPRVPPALRSQTRVQGSSGRSRRCAPPPRR